MHIPRHHRTKLLIPAVLLLGDGLFFGLINPNNASSVLLMVGFVLVLANLYLLMRLLQFAAGVYSDWWQQRKHLSGALTALFGSMLALQSIGQLTMRDFLLLPLAGLVLYSYLSFTTRSTEQ